MTIQQESEFEFGTHAVRSRNENRFLVIFRNFKQGTEAADGAEYPGNQGLFGKGFNAFN